MGTLRSLAFLTPGNHPDDDPFSGLDATLDLFAYGEPAASGTAVAAPVRSAGPALKAWVCSPATSCRESAATTS
ncbi:MAG TPA: hypothetical protein VN408_30720 [Actinoplanes sp.]|nr:hypothetical protein [Actinoplanes sp.]